MEILNRRGKKGGAMMYQFAAIQGLFRFESQQLTITLDKNIRREGKFKGVIVANGRFFGGGMKIAPHAELNDGLFDVIILGDVGKLKLAIKMRKVRSGTHIYEDGIEIARAKTITIECHGEVLLELDGEGPGKCPARYDILPAAINVIVP